MTTVSARINIYFISVHMHILYISIFDIVQNKQSRCDLLVCPNYLINDQHMASHVSKQVFSLDLTRNIFKVDTVEGKIVMYLEYKRIFIIYQGTT